MQTKEQQRLTASWLIKSPREISLDTKSWNCEKNTCDADGKADHVDGKRSRSFSKAVQDTDQRTVYIEEGTDPGQSDHKISCQITGKQKMPDHPSEDQK